jgi:hypothetical protein
MSRQTTPCHQKLSVLFKNDTDQLAAQESFGQSRTSERGVLLAQTGPKSFYTGQSLKDVVR